MTPQVKELHELRAENKALKAKLAETEMELIELKRKILDLMKKYASGGGVESAAGVSLERCVYNPAVECKENACDSCGWNPEVKSMRLERKS